MRRRVVVTGTGTANPLGLDPESSWKALLEGRPGVGPVTRFDASECPVRFAAEVEGFRPSRPLEAPIYAGRAEPLLETLPAKDVRRFGRFAQLAIHAGLQAYARSGLDAHRQFLSPGRMGVDIGVGMGGLPEIEAAQEDFLRRGYRRISPFFILQAIPNTAAGQLSLLLDLQGPNLCVATACATSAHSIGEAFRLVRDGTADVMLAGGAESVVSPLGIGGFDAMQALSRCNDDPERASRPFDRDRDGFVLGEGASVLVLEERNQALRRGAPILGEVLGFAATSDAHHLTRPVFEGAGAGRAMRQALADAELGPERVDYVNAHATSTPAGDVEEIRAISSLFGPTGRRPFVSSTKGATGHLLGGAGALEAVFCLMALRDGVVPHTANLENLDPSCDLDGIRHVVDAPEKVQVEIVLSNNFGFGGVNGSLLFGRGE